MDTTSTMDSIMDSTGRLHLIYRNGQLEAELRLVKEQLAQANSANQYLLTTLSTASANTHTEENARVQDDLEDVIRENVRLKAQLGLTPRITSNYPISTRTPRPRRKDSVAPLLDILTHESEVTVDELLSFNEEDASAVNATLQPQDPFEAKDSQKSKPKKDTVGVGIANFFSLPSFGTDKSDGLFDQASPAAPTQQRHGFEIKYADGTSSFVPTPAMTPQSSLSSAPSFARAPLPFLDGEHRQMAGSACYLEDYTEDERRRFWHKHAVSHPRHSGEEYIQYYENEIRPAYLAKMKAYGQESGIVATKVEEYHKPNEPVVSKEHVAPVEPEGDEPSMHSHRTVRPLPTHPADFDYLNVITPQAKSMPKSISDENVPVDFEHFTVPETTSMPVEQPAARSASPVPEVPSQLALSIHAAPQSNTEAPVTAMTSLPPISLDQVPPRFPPRYSNRPRFIPNRGAQEASDLFMTTYPEDPHAYRTVIISGVPPMVSLHKVLSSLPSPGRILSATLHETSGFRTTPPMTTNTVIIIFISGFEAKSFAKSNSTLRLSDFTASISLVPTITRPLTPNLVQQLRDQNLSRVVYILDTDTICTPDQIVEQLMRQGCRKPLLEKCDDDVPGLMVFEFASIFEAMRAKNVMERDYNFFGDIQRGYLLDPCAKGLGGMGNGEGNWVEVGEGVMNGGGKDWVEVGEGFTGGRVEGKGGEVEVEVEVGDET